MHRLLLSLAVLAASALPLQAQDSLRTPSEPPEWEEVSKETLRADDYPADSNASAVIISDVGEGRFTHSGEIEIEHHSKTGSRLFLSLNLTQRWDEVPPEMDEPRTQPVQAVPYPFVDVDSIRYKLPKGYDVEAKPESVSVDTDFATYEATVTREDGALVYRRRLEWRTKTLAPEQYESFRSFRQEVARADQAQAVLVKEKT